MSAHEAAEDARAPVGIRRRLDRRRGKVVAPGFQNRFRAKILALALAIALITLGLTRLVAYLVAHESLLDDVTVPIWLAVSSLVLAAGVLKLCDRVSHRVAGPAHRLRGTLQAVQRGERPRPVVLRKGDELQDLAEDLNAALQKLGAMDDPRD